MNVQEIAVFLRFLPNGEMHLSAEMTLVLGRVTKKMPCSPEEILDVMMSMGQEATEQEPAEQPYAEEPPERAAVMSAGGVINDSSYSEFEVEEEPEPEPEPEPVRYGTPRRVAGPPRRQAAAAPRFVETDSAGNPILRVTESQVNASSFFSAENPGENGVDVL